MLEDTPAKIRGNWAMPDCGASNDEAIMITRHFYLRAEKDGTRFWPIDGAIEKKDYWVVPIEEVMRPVLVTADGVLKIGILDPPPKKWPARWDKLTIDNRREYTNCVEVPAILPDPMVRVMQHIDEIDTACHVGLSPACTKLLFSIADENGDGKISRAEIKSAAMMLTSFALLAKNNVVSRADLDKIIYANMREADRIADHLMPKQRGLYYSDFSGFVKKAHSQPLRGALKDISIIVPGVDK